MTASLRVLGATELRAADGREPPIVRQPKILALLTWLALATVDGFRRRDQIVGLFWPELEQEAARGQLRKMLFALREQLGTDAVLTRGEAEVRLNGEVVWCDAVALLREAQPNRALAHYRGELLEGLFPEGVAQEYHDWLSEQRRILRERAAAAAWDCAGLAEENGDRPGAAAHARRAVELAPDDEQGVRRLISLLDRNGDRIGALKVYGALVQRLQAEYGVEPAPETRKLARRVQASRKGESHETPPTPPPALGAAEAAPGVGSLARRPRGRRLAAAAVLTVALGTMVAVAAVRDTRPAAGSVGLMTLRSIGGGRSGIEATRLTEELSQAFVTAGFDLRAGSQGQVAAHVEGAVQAGNRLRVTLRLVRVRDGMALWAGTYDAELADAGAAERIAREAAVAIGPRLRAMADSSR